MKKIKEIHQIEFNNVSFHFSGEEAVFENVNYNFSIAKNVRIIGSTGSGKSTFLKILAGLELPTQGQYLINGVSVGDLSFEEFTDYRLAIGYSFEFGGLLNNKTLKENILLPMQYHRSYDVPGGKERVYQLIEKAGLKETADSRPSMVPGSHRKMTIVLRSLIMRPQLLILDEPTTGLTTENKKFLVDLLNSEQEQGFLKTIIFSSNDEKFFENIPNTRLYLREKKILYSQEEINREAV